MRVLALACMAILLSTFDASAERLRVVASLPPLALIAEAVAGERADVIGLGDGGEGHEHGGRLRPSDARALAGADLAFWVGPVLEPTLARALPADAIALGDAAGITPRDGVDGRPDLHVWLSPANAAVLAREMAEALAARDPDGAATYGSNADALIARIDAVGADARRRLAPLSAVPYAVEHDAFGHFADWVGLEPASTATGQGARSLRAAATDAAERGVACVIAEPGEPARIARVLGDTVPTVTVDPLGRDAPHLPGLIAEVTLGFERCLRNGA